MRFTVTGVQSENLSSQYRTKYRCFKMISASDLLLVKKIEWTDLIYSNIYLFSNLFYSHKKIFKILVQLFSRLKKNEFIF